MELAITVEYIAHEPAERVPRYAARFEVFAERFSRTDVEAEFALLPAETLTDSDVRSRSIVRSTTGLTTAIGGPNSACGHGEIFGVGGLLQVQLRCSLRNCPCGPLRDLTLASFVPN